MGSVRFRNWRREIGMTIATTSSSKLSDHRKGHVAIESTTTTKRSNNARNLKTFELCAVKEQIDPNMTHTGPFYFRVEITHFQTYGII